MTISMAFLFMVMGSLLSFMISPRLPTPGPAVLIGFSVSALTMAFAAHGIHGSATRRELLRAGGRSRSLLFLYLAGLAVLVICTWVLCLGSSLSWPSVLVILTGLTVVGVSSIIKKKSLVGSASQRMDRLYYPMLFTTVMVILGAVMVYRLLCLY